MTVSFSDTELVEMVAQAEKVGGGFYECLSRAARSKDATDLFARIARDKKSMSESWKVSWAPQVATKRRRHILTSTTRT